jgi:sec-independent protein translocase protein TatB
VFDIGIGEILVLGLLGLLIFGPEKLPRAAADAARWLRQVRSMAASARQDLANSAGVDFQDAKDAFRDIADLHPRRIASSIMTDGPEADARPAPAPAPAPAKEAPKTPSTPAPFDPDAP